MKMRGRLKDILQDVRNGGWDVSFHVQAVPSGVEAFREDTDLAITLAKWREQRSTTANAYYWVIATKIRDTINTERPDVHVTLPEVHNILLRKYGTLEVINGEHYYAFIPDTEEAWKDVLQKEIYHLKPTSRVKDGRRVYVMIKGSSEYDSKEFSLLLSGALSEAAQMGIEILPPEEIERMMEDYEKHFTR